MSSSAKLAVLVSLLSLLVFAAAFMPWGTINALPTMTVTGMPFPAGEMPFGGMRMEMTMTGWNGSMSPGGFKLPNWLVVLAAGAIATLVWVRAKSITAIPGALPIALAIYGLLHAALAGFVLVGSSGGSLGVGTLLTAAAFLGMVVLLVRGPRPIAAA